MKPLIYFFTILLSILIASCEKEDFKYLQRNSKILFISRRIENNAAWNLISMNNDGSEQIKVTDLTVNYGKPVISHSGKTVLFVHYSETFFNELYSINIDGTNLTLIDRANRYCGSADWSSNDSKIVYSKNRNDLTDDKDLILFDIISGNKYTLTTSFNNISAKFSSDNRIVFCQQNSTANDIYLMNIDGTDKQMIVSNAGNPVCSPDGKSITYVSTGDMGSPQIFIANYNGTNSHQLTKTYLPCSDSGFPTFGNHGPQWTPDGEKIVFESDVNDGMPEIYIMNSDGSNQKRLTNTDGRNENPELSSNGEFILFSSNRDMNFNSDIYVMDIDGKNQYSLSKYVGDDCLPAITNK